MTISEAQLSDDWSANIDDVDRNEFRRQCALELGGVDADKSLWFDGTGLVLLSKIIEQGHFAAIWERASTGVARSLLRTLSSNAGDTVTVRPLRRPIS